MTDPTFDPTNPIERLRAVDPAAAVAPAAPERLARFARTAMTPPTPRFSHARYRLVATCASVTSAAAVLAGILALEASGPALPVLALSSRTVGAAADAPTAHGMMVIWGSFDITKSDGFTATGGGAPALELSSASVSPEDVIATVAPTVGLSGPITQQDQVSIPGVTQSPNYLMGDPNGANLQASAQGGTISWTYTASTPQAITTPAVSGDGTSAATSDTQPAPSDQEAIAAARAVLDAADGLESASSGLELGTPTTTDGSGDVSVEFTLSAGGLETDLVDAVDVGPNGVILSASGTVANADRSVAYPTISADDAVATITAQAAAQAAQEGLGATTTTTGSDPTTTDSSGATSVPPSGVGATDPSGTVPTTDAPAPGTTDTTVPSDNPPTVSTPPVYTVVVERAVEQYAENTLADGSTWLLPVWDLQGTSNSGDGTPQTPGWERQVMEIAPQYFDLAPQVITY